MSTNENNLIEWDNNLLEPIIITYNRASLLQKTLQAFYDSGLTTMNLHVLNNASTDNTKTVVEHFQRLWPNLIYHENRYNIGGNANILRSVELSQSTYHWVIGDDDEWLLANNVNELLSVIKTNQADIIRLGWLVSTQSRGFNLPATTLINDESLFFASVSMISATIIRRSLVSKYLPLAYQNIADSYPQLVPIIRAIEELPITVYTTSTDLMKHIPSREAGYFYGDLEWYAGWYRTSRFFNNRALKSKFIDEVTLYMCREKKPNELTQFTWLLKVMLYYKSFGLKQTNYLTTMLIHAEHQRYRLRLLNLINYVSPVMVLRFLRKLYFKFLKLPPKTLHVDRSRL